MPLHMIYTSLPNGAKRSRNQWTPDLAKRANTHELNGDRGKERRARGLAGRGGPRKEGRRGRAEVCRLQQESGVGVRAWRWLARPPATIGLSHVRFSLPKTWCNLCIKAERRPGEAFTSHPRRETQAWRRVRETRIHFTMFHCCLALDISITILIYLPGLFDAIAVIF